MDGSDQDAMGIDFARLGDFWDILLLMRWRTYGEPAAAIRGSSQMQGLKPGRHASRERAGIDAGQDTSLYWFS